MSLLDSMMYGWTAIPTPAMPADAGFADKAARVLYLSPDHTLIREFAPPSPAAALVREQILTALPWLRYPRFRRSS